MMKKIFSLSVMLLAASALTMSPKKPSSPLQFEETVYDFGNIREADGPVSHTFEFVNEGEEPVIILSATASCGCTRPEFPKKPVKAGGKSSVKVTYNPAGRPGEFSREVRLKTSSKSAKKITLRIKGVVIPKNDPQP